MNQFKSAKIAYVVFALVIFSLVANIVYLGVTGKHLISGADIATFAKSRGKAKTIDYATRGEIYTSDNEVVASNVKKYKLIAIVSSSRINHGKDDAYVKDITATANAIAPGSVTPSAGFISSRITLVSSSIFPPPFLKFLMLSSAIIIPRAQGRKRRVSGIYFPSRGLPV